MQIRQAIIEDTPVILQLLNDCAEWITNIKGIEQWPVVSPDPELDRAIESGEQYVGIIDGDIVATLRLQSEDLFTWKDSGAISLYVHQLAVRRDRKGQQLGKQMLEWCDEQIKARKRTLLRLDCLASNTELRNYYQSLGFTYVGDIDQHAGKRSWISSLLERPVQ